MAYYNITKSITLKLNYNNFVKVLNTCSNFPFLLFQKNFVLLHFTKTE